jgi:hypothetical protein
LDAPLVRAFPNRLLAAIARKGRNRLIAACDDVSLHALQIVHEPGDRIRHVYFPIGSLVSMMIPVDGRSIIEVELVGDEGMIGLPLVQGVDISPLRAVVQGAGPALRMGAATFRRELDASPQLNRVLQRYVQVCFWQLAQASACTRFHLVEQRLARWLVMTQDRAHCSQFHVTHEVLASMLGVRRVGVTRAASALQRHGLIRYHRGDVTILDRAGLRAAACSCYQSDRNTYDKLIPVPVLREMLDIEEEFVR